MYLQTNLAAHIHFFFNIALVNTVFSIPNMAQFHKQTNNTRTIPFTLELSMYILCLILTISALSILTYCQTVLSLECRDVSFQNDSTIPDSRAALVQGL